MKVEHIEAIERARRHGIHPMVFAHQLMVRDLVEAALFELRNIKVPFQRLGEDDQQEVIDRITGKAEDVVSAAVGIISSRSVDTIPIKIADSKFKEKNITVTGVVDAQDPNRHGLIDLSGKLALLVLAPNDYAEGTDGIRAERDQRELPLSAGAIADAMFAERRAPVEDDDDKPEHATTSGTDPLYSKAVDFVIESRRPTISSVQRALGIGFNRATTLMNLMEKEGVVSPIDHTGAREVMVAGPEGASGEQDVDLDPTPQTDASNTPTVEGFDTFGEHSYNDASQLVVLHGDVIDVAWLQRRLAIDSELATSLLLRLLEDNVIQLEAEAEERIDYTYKVTASLADVVGVDA